jgi:hypothetical protein
MRRPRIGFRCFFLIVTLASLAVAAFAIRARTTSFQDSQGSLRGRVTLFRLGTRLAPRRKEFLRAWGKWPGR